MVYRQMWKDKQLGDSVFPKMLNKLDKQEMYRENLVYIFEGK